MMTISLPLFELAYLVVIFPVLFPFMMITCQIQFCCFIIRRKCSVSIWL